MKRHAPVAPLFVVSLAVALLGAAPPGAHAQAENGPHAQTKPALQCMLGFGPTGCQTIFGAAATVISNRARWKGGPDPYFRTADYVWKTEGGDEVWDVKYMNTEMTYVISPPDADGMVRRISILQGSPDRQCDDIVGKLQRGGRIWQNCQVFFQST